MIDFDDGDQILNLIGAILVLALIFAVAVLFLAATSVQQQSAKVPDTDWDLQQINESHVRIVHAAGEPVAASKLSVTVDGTPTHPQWTAKTLTEGEYGAVRVDEGITITLLWQQSEHERDVLQRWRLSRRTTQSAKHSLN